MRAAVSTQPSADTVDPGRYKNIDWDAISETPPKRGEKRRDVFIDEMAEATQPEPIPVDESQPRPQPLLGRDLGFLGPLGVRSTARMRELAAAEINYIWQDYVESSTVAVIAGAPSSGKTSLAFLIAVARASTCGPRNVLGRQVTPAPPNQFVVLIEGEHGEASTARKLLKSAELLDLNDETTDRILFFARKALLIGSKEWLGLVALIATGCVSDVFIDTVARCAPSNAGDANSEKDQIAIYSAIAAALEKSPNASTTAWVLAHTRKGGGTGLEDVSGSAQRVGQADTVLIVRAKTDAHGQVIGSITTLAKAREKPENYPEECTMHITADGITISAAAQEAAAKAAAKAGPLSAAILVVLSASPDWQHARHIRDSLKASRGKEPNKLAVARALEELVSAGSVETKPDHVGGNGKLIDAWRRTSGRP